MKKIKVLFFAILRDYSGKAEELMETEVSTAKEFFNEINTKYNFPLTIEEMSVAINDEFSTWETKLNSGDEIAFIPPVAGG